MSWQQLWPNCVKGFLLCWTAQHGHYWPENPCFQKQWQRQQGQSLNVRLKHTNYNTPCMLYVWKDDASRFNISQAYTDLMISHSGIVAKGNIRMRSGCLIRVRRTDYSWLFNYTHVTFPLSLPRGIINNISFFLLSACRCWACSVPAWCCAGGVMTQPTSCWSQPTVTHEGRRRAKQSTQKMKRSVTGHVHSRFQL